MQRNEIFRIGVGGRSLVEIWGEICVARELLTKLEIGEDNVISSSFA
jgi:hypothetical protein